MSFQTPITIKEAVENIDNHTFLLPAIQREFVWSHTKIEWLFDSIMRNYPISSFLFWQVEGDTKNGYRFYKFINEYRETFKTHNEEISTDGINDFQAVLDGQQRLTSIYIGLKGSYAYRLRGALKADKSERSRPTRHLYLNISNALQDEEDGRIYEFKFLKKAHTKEQEIYVDKKSTVWFRVGAILNYENEEIFDNFVEDLESKFARKAIRQLRRTILEKALINYFLEKEQDLDKALNIFIRINSGGEPLNFSDLIMSIAVANWRKTDAREAIHTLVDNIRDKGFSISKDFVLKTFLYLYSKDIKFKVTNFSNENAKDFEDKWEEIRDTILEVFDLVKSFGFTDYTLTSKNAIIPIIYYLFHKNIYQEFTMKIGYKSQREMIKRWLHTMLIKRVFGGSSDVTLSQVRHAFTDNFEEMKIKDEIVEFPLSAINSKIKKDISVSQEFMKELLCIQKDDKYAFSLLSLLYPHLDYRNNHFHKDHLHPISTFTKEFITYLTVTEEIKEKYYQRCVYNGIYNLQMLDANENMSKNDKSLKAWIEEETKNQDKKQFLENHLIPAIDFSIENFKEFIDKREEILLDKLKLILQ